MPLIKRSFYIPCKSSECIKIAEIIREKAPAVGSMDLEIRDNGIYITMYGYKTDIKNAWEYIRRMIIAYKQSIIEYKGYRRISIDYLVSKIKHTFPPKLLVEIIKHMGHSIDIDDHIIVTNAPLEIIEDTAKRIVELMDTIKYDVRGKTTKYYVITLSILTNKDPSEIYEKGLMLNHLIKDEDDKYRIRVEWRKAILDFLNTYKD
ncbi:MAG: hypothetical protein B6U89_00875 [Desulfurococcales archaeon ex4484_58]|nr:MAG: hypothetical protein B6U89_00875 [Desulfurococcales archaeon ex4484_58]